jgi:ABC-2 type transport system permease protein
LVSTVRHYYSVAACFARLAVQRQLEYPMFLVSWLLMIPIAYLSGAWMLKIIIDRFHSLNGWGFPQLAFIYGLGLLSHGVMVVFFINTWHIDNMVVQGNFDRLLLRPMNVFFQLIASYVNFIGLIDMIPGSIIFIYASHLVGMDWSFLNILKLILIIGGGVFIRAALFICLGSISFWTKRSASLVGFTLTLLERTTMYPLNIYPIVLQMIFTFLIPIGFISFYPASEFLGQASGFHIPLSMALWTPIMGIVCFMISQFIFTIGMKKYESAGS